MKIKYQLLLCILLSPVVSWGQKVLHVQSPDMKTELQVMIGKELDDAQHQTGDQKCKTFQTTFHNTVPPEIVIIATSPSRLTACHLP